MILHPCPDCGKLTPDSHCPAHAKAKRRKRYARQDASRRARGKRVGTSAAYRRARTKALARDGHRCTFTTPRGRCTATTGLETHHLNGNALDDRVENLATVCSPHHALIERKLKAKRYKGLRIVSLVGGPGTGKSTLAKQLAQRFGLPFAEIDDFGARGDRDRRWSGLMEWITSHRCPILIESNVVMPELGELLNAVPHLVIELQAPREVRVERLRQRGEREAEIERMLSKESAVGYAVDHVEADGRVRAEVVARAVEGFIWP